MKRFITAVLMSLVVMAHAETPPDESPPAAAEYAEMHVMHRLSDLLRTDSDGDEQRWQQALDTLLSAILLDPIKINSSLQVMNWQLDKHDRDCSDRNIQAIVARLNVQIVLRFDYGLSFDCKEIADEGIVKTIHAQQLQPLPDEVPVAGQPVWGDERLRLTLVGDRLQVNQDGAAHATLEWPPSAEFLMRARADDAESAQLVWVDSRRGVIALVDGDHLELRWLTVQGDGALESLPLPTRGHSHAALVWPEECELPVLRVDYPEGRSTLVAATAKGPLQEVQRAENLDGSPSPLAYSDRLVVGAFTRGGPGIHTWLWWYRCASPKGSPGRIDLQEPLIHPVLVAGSQTLLAFDHQWPHGYQSPAPLYRIDAASAVLERLTPCPIEARPTGVLGPPDARPLRLRCWTGGNSPSAEFEVTSP